MDIGKLKIMDNVTFKKLKKTHGDRAEEIFDQIAKIGGWGEGREYRNSDGLDLAGLSEAKRAQIDKLLEIEPESDEADLLVKNNDRKALDKMAKDLGLDGNSYTDKKELAAAIVQKQKGE